MPATQIPTIISKHSSLRNQTSADSGTTIQAFTVKRHPVYEFEQVFQSNLTNKYYLAGTARAKLAYEAEEVDHNLLRLVGHANFLDRLQDEIDSAEKLHETRHKAKLVRQTVSPRKGSIVWVDKKEDAYEDSGVSDDDQTSSDSEGEEEILGLVRLPTRYSLPQAKTASPAKDTARNDPATSKQVQVKVVQVSSMLPRVAEESEEVVEGVTSLLEAMNREIVLSVA